MTTLTKRIRALFAKAHECRGGPLDGGKLVLTEHSPNTAWIEVRGQVGRYVNGRWEALTTRKRK